MGRRVSCLTPALPEDHRVGAVLAAAFRWTTATLKAPCSRSSATRTRSLLDQVELRAEAKLGKQVEIVVYPAAPRLLLRRARSYRPGGREGRVGKVKAFFKKARGLNGTHVSCSWVGRRSPRKVLEDRGGRRRDRRRRVPAGQRRQAVQ
jgi:hypothetical protein